MDYDKWNELSKQKAVTIKDILSLKQGEQLKLLIMDRNVWDIALRDEIRGKVSRPKDFFKRNWGIYIHESNLKGKLVFEFETCQDTDFLDIEKLPELCQPEFEFHIEFEDDCWYPLKNGYLPATDRQKICKFPWTKPQHWSVFPESTRIGFRGHCLKWSTLDDMPDIIWPFPVEAIYAFDNEDDVTISRTFRIEVDNSLVRSICTKFRVKGDESELAVKRFVWELIDKIKKYKKNIKYPILFSVAAIETTPKSKKNIYKFNIKCEDGPKINSLQRLG